MAIEAVGCRVALVMRGSRELRDTTTVDSFRLNLIAKALADIGLAPEPAFYSEDMGDEVREQLLGVGAVLVWVDPVAGSDDRTQLDAILREVAATGVYVSAHPDVIAKMGTKEVLYRTRELGWGSETFLYRTFAEFNESFPERLAAGEARVLKQYRGNGGIGVWKVQFVSGHTSRPEPDTVVLVQSARARDDVVDKVPLGDFMVRCRKYFGYGGGEGRLIDQPFQPGIAEGLIRCYLVKNEVVGFARQYPAGRAPTELELAGDAAPPPEKVFGLPAAKTMYAADGPTFQTLRQRVEAEWVPAMQTLVDVDAASLPALWDADFLFGPKSNDGEDNYVLSEINVSSVLPFPEQALPKLAGAVVTALQSANETAATSS
jgi:hypothetical protein